ncbi:MAG: DUF4399 domain-containing protein [Porticoccaceae bacterium]|nr:DUF4399 domain-containing protein [Porticoccaceae bacterium]
MFKVLGLSPALSLVTRALSSLTALFSLTAFFSLTALFSLTAVAGGHLPDEKGAHEHHHHDHGSMHAASAAVAQVSFIQPTDGQVFKSGEVKVVFGIEGMSVAPAGTDTPNSGHHHLLINVEQMPDMTMPLPASDSIRHFGKGQTETTLNLAPGTHRLQLLLGNYAHIPHNPPVMSDVIEITVK